MARAFDTPINTNDQSLSLTQRYGIHGIPTMMLVKVGKIINRWSGALPETAIRSKLAPVLI